MAQSAPTTRAGGADTVSAQFVRPAGGASCTRADGEATGAIDLLNTTWGKPTHGEPTTVNGASCVASPGRPEVGLVMAVAWNSTSPEQR